MDKYFSDKANIYRWQKEGDWFIAGPRTAKIIKEKNKKGVNGQMIIADKKISPVAVK